MFEIIFSSKARKFIKKCDEKTRKIIKQVLLQVSINPFPAKDFDFRKVSGENNTYRIRISSHRIVYEVNVQEKIIKIIRLERRKGRTYDF